MFRFITIFSVITLVATFLNVVFISANEQQSIDPCNVFNTCLSCVRANLTNTSCGWCAATQTCLTGGPFGPFVGKCLAAWEFLECRQCDRMTSCRECTQFPADCIWCGNTKTCHHVESPLPIDCFPTELCDCKDYRRCADCVRSSICKWCPDQNMCIDIQHNGTCYEHRCPCSSHRSCDLCLDDDQCDWCIDNMNERCVESDNSTCSVRAVNCELNCEHATSCIACQSLNNACGWCPTIGKCVDTNVNTQCPIERMCSDDPKRCTARKNCEACLGIPGDPCVWCNDRCVQSINDCPSGAQQSCPAPSSFSGASFVGGMFLVIGLLILAVVGYVVYMRVRGKRLNYSVVS